MTRAADVVQKDPTRGRGRSTDLLRARQYLADSEKLLQRQKDLICKLQRQGRPMERALAVLAALQTGCIQLRNYLDVVTALNLPDG
jgi:hypothetical protein